MRAKLKQLSSPDIDLNNYWPEDENNFGFLLEASIGLEHEGGADVFSIMVCTPDWIKSEYLSRKNVWGRHMLIVFNYDLDEIKKVIIRYIENCTGDNWLAIAQKISRVGAWEFEDYQT